MICEYCHTDPGTKPHSDTMWNGFLDADTNQLVCWQCQEKHYEAKAKTEFADQYSELPVTVTETHRQ